MDNRTSYVLLCTLAASLFSSVAIAQTAPSSTLPASDAAAPTSAATSERAATDSTSPAPVDDESGGDVDTASDDAASADAASADAPSAAATVDDNAATNESPSDDATGEATADDAPAGDDGMTFSAADDDDPTLLERRIVAFVALGVSVTSLAVGAGFGFLAWQQFNCLQDIKSCNETLADPIRGEDYFAARSDVEHKALIADMAYLFAGASAVVAVTAFLRGFVFTGEESETPEDDAVSMRNVVPPVAIGSPARAALTDFGDSE